MESRVKKSEIRSLFTSREAVSDGSHFFVKYRLQPVSGLSMAEAAAHILLITSMRTMSPLSYEPVDTRSQHSGAVVSIEDTGQVELAYPISLCTESEGLPHLLQVITAGAEYAYTEDIWIESVDFPQSFLSRFQGPRFGIEGFRTLFKVYDRPILGLIVKPRVGVPIDRILLACDEALRGGVDFLVDDLLMVDPAGSMAFRERVPKFVDLVERRSSGLARKKLYFANCSFGPRRTFEAAEWVHSVGVGAVVLNGFTLGLGGLQETIDGLNGKIPFVTTNMGTGMMSRGTALAPPGRKPTGMSEAVISKLSRMAGADAVHAGTSASECYGEDAWGPAIHALKVKNGLKTSFAVAEGDLTVANVWQNIQSLSNDVLIEPTAGIINFPGGPAKGAESFQRLLEVLRYGMSDQEAHDNIVKLVHKDKALSAGLKQFGYKPPK